MVWDGECIIKLVGERRGYISASASSSSQMTTGKSKKKVLTSAVGHRCAGLPPSVTTTQVDGGRERSEEDVAHRAGRPAHLTPGPRQAVEIAVGRRFQSGAGFAPVVLGWNQCRCAHRPSGYDQQTTTTATTISWIR